MKSNVQFPSKLLQNKIRAKRKEAIRREIKNLCVLEGSSRVCSWGQMKVEVLAGAWWGSGSIPRRCSDMAWVRDYAPCRGLALASAWPHLSFVRTKTWVLVRSAKSLAQFRSAILRITYPDQFQVWWQPALTWGVLYPWGVMAPFAVVFSLFFFFFVK